MSKKLKMPKITIASTRVGIRNEMPTWQQVLLDKMRRKFTSKMDCWEEQYYNEESIVDREYVIKKLNFFINRERLEEARVKDRLARLEQGKMTEEEYDSAYEEIEEEIVEIERSIRNSRIEIGLRKKEIQNLNRSIKFLRIIIKEIEQAKGVTSVQV